MLPSGGKEAITPDPKMSGVHQVSHERGDGDLLDPGSRVKGVRINRNAGPLGRRQIPKVIERVQHFLFEKRTKSVNLTPLKPPSYFLDRK